MVLRLRAAAHALFPPQGEEKTEKSEDEAERHHALGYWPSPRRVKPRWSRIGRHCPLTEVAEALPWNAHVGPSLLGSSLSSPAAVVGLGHTTAGPSPATLGLIALVVCVPVVAAVLIVLLVGWTRAVLRRQRQSAARLRAAISLEDSARAQMSELCPHGWRAQVTLFGPGDELPAGAPTGDRARVALDWAELDDDDGHIAVVRRVWAPTVAEALEAMVADRRTDETLERIERSVTTWPEG
jgi:hypothetical protein